MKFGLSENIIESIRNVLETNPKVDNACIFGSRAKGNYRDASDIDIAFKGFDISFDDVLQLGVKFDDLELPYKVDLIDYNSIKEPDLKDHIDRVGIEFYSRWKEVKLGDVLEIKYGKDHKEINEGEIPIYGSGGIMRYGDKALYDKKSILIPRKGSLNNIFYKEEPFWTVDTMFWTKINEEKVNPKFLFYQLKKVDYTNLNVGSAVPSLTVPVIEAIDITLPPLSEQTAIASILSSLDDKIDLLHQQNKTLEQLAETLFRHWFVEEAEDYELGCFGDVISIFDNLRVPVSSMEREKMKIGKLYPYYGAAKIMDYINDYIFDGEYVLMGEDGTVQTEEGFPILQMPTGKFWVNNHTHVLQAKKPYSNYIIYIFLKQTNINHIITGAVQPKINQENLKLLDFPILPEEKIIDFVKITNDYWEKIKSNQTQIRTLTQTRDTLLPKLMSGEVRVSL